MGASWLLIESQGIVKAWSTRTNSKLQPSFLIPCKNPRSQSRYKLNNNQDNKTRSQFFSFGTIGGEAQAKTTLVYGVQIAIPNKPCWPLMLKRLKELGRSKHDQAEATTETELTKMNEEGNKEKEEETEEGPKKKKANLTSSANNKVLLSVEEANQQEEEHGESYESWDGYDQAALVNENKSNLARSFKLALKRNLDEAHSNSLSMKIYHSSDYERRPETTFSLLIQIENSSWPSTFTYSGIVGVTAVKMPVLVEPETSSYKTMIQNAMSLLGFEAEHGECRPEWLMVTTCSRYE